MVWLVAICVPLGPSLAYSCGCQSVWWQGEVASAENANCHCGVGGCCALAAASSTCCHRSPDSDSSTKTSSSRCCCKHDNQPASEPVSIPARSTDSQQLALPFCQASVVGFTEREGVGVFDGSWATLTTSSAIERCCLLCRFTL